ncbi:MAG: transporter substrate-binding domain-containing protein [Saccharospirillaceae bacterium]|nr:transporter substrate-binding domain-containing protein [Pseudomonadales bacterium]NRB80922.1 transporter substrate-binding domain-containing protein [Saccharospirillaceae bacterium]
MPILKILPLLFGLLFSVMLSAKEKINIMTTTYPPFQYEINGELTGISYDIVQAIVTQADLSSQIDTYVWNRVKRNLDTLSNQYFFNLSRTPIRENQFYWIADITPNNMYLWQYRWRTDIEINNFKDAGNYIIGDLKGSVSHQYLLEQGIPAEQFSTVTEDRMNIMMLERGRIDLLPFGELSFLYQLKLLGFKQNDFIKILALPDISSRSYFVANKSANTDNVNRLKQAWDKILANGTYQEIIDRYMQQK